MVKVDKIVYMECPRCHRQYPVRDVVPVANPMGIPVLDLKTGKLLMQEVTFKTCSSCGSGLIRRVVKEKYKKETTKKP